MLENNGDNKLPRFDVEVLNFGSVAFGKLWSNKNDIFPKGILLFL